MGILRLVLAFLALLIAAGIAYWHFFMKPAGGDLSLGPLGYDSGRVFSTESRGRTAYHLDWRMGSEMLIMGEDLTAMGGRRMGGLAGGGQFEVLVHKDYFPVSAPYCDEFIIIRMPWTDPGLAEAALYVGEKERFYAELLRIRDEGGAIDVAIDLHPYVNVLSEDPLKLELEGCNVFFRDVQGRYYGANGESTPVEPEVAAGE